MLVPVEQQNVAPFEAVNPDAFARDLAAAINRVLSDPDLRESMAENGMKRAREVFSWTNIAHQTEALYQTLV